MKTFSYLAIISFAVILSSCGSSRVAVGTYLEHAEAAVKRQDWEVAYRFIEDGLVYTRDEEKSKSNQLAKKHPEIIEAGYQTFSPESIAKTLALHGESSGVALERKRLAMFKIVASDSQYQNAKTNLDVVAVSAEKIIEEQKRVMAEKWKIAEEERLEKQKIADAKRLKEEEARTASEKYKQKRRQNIVEAAQKSKILCKDTTECQKAFALAQIFVSEKSDMKIQVATEAIIETYNPTEYNKTGLKVIKIPKKGSSSEILLTVSCREEIKGSYGDECEDKRLEIYLTFPEFIQSSLLR